MATLKGLYGETKGLVFELSRDETTIGRHGANMLTLPDASVSSFHCTIVKDGGKYSIRDLDSTNGTRVNGDLVKIRRLASGNILQIGFVELLLEGADIEADADSESAPAPRAPAIPRRAAGGTRRGFSTGKRHGSKIVWIVVALLSLLGIAGAVVLAACVFHLR